MESCLKALPEQDRYYVHEFRCGENGSWYRKEEAENFISKYMPINNDMMLGLHSDLFEINIIKDYINIEY